ncbi:hypothetical protein BN1051_00118 [Arthrobacter saudimassiliensis]|uniref:Uncharacterized protein n=1 Tax=Arthrobacter saudimassiliensis TaxID=1461584 RepID=A0A078MKI0_9MICC|nr:hypothetical protein BN1051_00118 [Arthrobacter saudimassiliensis]
MPGTLISRCTNPERGTPWGRRLAAVLVAAGLIATTSCTQDPEPEPVSNPVKVFQNVRVDLSPAAGVETIEGTTISVAADGASSAEDTVYDTADVVGELPVRVSLQYRAGEKSGTDLNDLAGHTGPVEINVTLENLTVKPQVIQYDAAGQARSETALVGAPLTVAASTKLEGVQADDITPGTADGAAGTNGVLSRTEEGAAVVQWAAVLAPPRTGASTTLRLVADVEDFQVPSFDLAVQPGLTTDLSAEGVVSSAFSTGAGSEMELQQRTISLVSDVNTVLTRAGSMITEVRRNLEVTSQTLGVQTAAELRENSESLATTMSALKEQLQVLGADLQAATEATESTALSQLQQTVAAVDSMLGDTSATIPTAQIDGNGCAAEVDKPEQAGTVYGSVLTMASQLDAYAKVSAGCRDLVAAELQAAIGPEKPTLEACAQELADQVEQGVKKPTPSLACSISASGVILTGTMLDLLAQGQVLVDGLEGLQLERAAAGHQVTNDALNDLLAEVTAILDADPDQDYETALKGVEDSITTVTESLEASVASTRTAAREARDSIDGLRQQLLGVEEVAGAARQEIVGGPFLAPSMAEQISELAAELCDVAEGEEPGKGRLSVEDAEELRSYLTADPCAEKDAEGNPTAPLTPPPGFDEPLSARLEAQAASWDAVLAAMDTTDPDAVITQAFEDLETEISGIENITLDDVRDAVALLDAAAKDDVQGSRTALEELKTALEEAVTSSNTVTVTLAQLQKDQTELVETLYKEIAETSDQAEEAVDEVVNQQIRQVAEIGDNSSGQVVDAFNQSISGLKTTSDGVVTDAKGTVDEQRKDLEEQSGALAGALAESTQRSLERIAAGTSGSTRDVEGASALLSSSLNKVMLDLGDRSVNGSGLLGSMTTNAAKAETADYQLALASQNAEGYANIRSQNVNGLLLRQAQFKASLTAVDELPAFAFEVPAGATSQTLYTLTIGGGE